MGPTALVVRLGWFGALASAVVACTVDTGSSVEGYAGGPAGGSTCTGCDEGGTASGGSTRPSASPMLVRVDPNVTMNASPGKGVGVFSEYDTGGRWHLWWTCDTTVTGESCPFDVKISAATGTITDSAADAFRSSDTLVTPSTPAGGESGGIEAKTLTTDETQGVYFDTDPGATIRVTATVGGLYDGRFFFWVQGGKVDDGFRGTVTDPLELVGASP
jgi:hypothetical protein